MEDPPGVGGRRRRVGDVLLGEVNVGPVTVGVEVLTWGGSGLTLRVDFWGSCEYRLVADEGGIGSLSSV